MFAPSVANCRETSCSEATVTWREGPNQQKAYEFLIGSDPARVPRKINRWGFIVEELRGDEADILGIMKESGEQSLDEAKAKVDREGATSTFKAARTHIAGNRAESGVITLQAPSHLTYRDVDEVLALVPAKPPDQKTLDLPPGTKRGFLVALETLLQSSIRPCSGEGSRAKEVPVVRYLYNRDLFDLSVDECSVERELETGTQTFGDVIDGRFHLKNLTTRNAMTFHVAYGTSGDLRGIPVRMMFRPRWWMEIELELNRSSAARLTSIAHQESERLVHR